MCVGGGRGGGGKGGSVDAHAHPEMEKAAKGFVYFNFSVI